MSIPYASDETHHNAKADQEEKSHQIGRMEVQEDMIRVSL
jgi:hypothetical protein